MYGGKGGIGLDLGEGLLKMRTSIDQCLLCESAPADKKGSHIIPSFLTSTGINYKGVKGRDKELMIVMRARGFNETYFGRNVPAEAIEDFKGKALSDEEIQANINPNIQDHIFCTDCEKKLAVIENHFAKEVDDPLAKNKFPSKISKNGYELVEIEQPRSLITRLFFETVIWRSSIANNSAFKLSEEVERKLRSVINECLDFDIRKVIGNCKTNFDRLAKFPLIITYLENEEDSTKGAVYPDKSKIPHFLMVNQFVLQFFDKEKHLKAPLSNSLYGLTKLLNRVEVINVMEDSVIVNKLTVEQAQELRSQVLIVWMLEMKQEIRITFSKLHEILLGFRPGEDVVYAVTHRIVHSAVSSGEKYTYENIQQQIVEFMLEYQEYFLKHRVFPRYTLEQP
jgi:hypothetical protein